MSERGERERKGRGGRGGRGVGGSVPNRDEHVFLSETDVKEVEAMFNL